ncbi:host attachment protein [Massilia arenosa]|uniref:Host attachment protein n=1 Tax=Zemynaea arenosa TaxID=2561931 RepID=A0A4Y9S761_9BURK|nr:host attachment protein [Massilia arenosa]TFW17095.1 host attachment protein [Massilia arenosa]
MKTTWIVSANASRARIFREHIPSQSLEEVEDMVNEAARLRTDESQTDGLDPLAAGKSQHGTGGATPTKQYQPRETPTQHANHLFAKELSHYLVEAHAQGKFDDLELVASPEFLGVLRNNLDDELKPLIKQEINKDYTYANANEFAEQLKAWKH